ncbi:hypothetical protein HPB47_015767, partial [Ixodes persulcatus]
MCRPPGDLQNANVQDKVEGRKSIQDKFHLCQSLQEDDYVTFRDFLHDVYSNMALVNYADPSVFLTPLPGYPVK